MKRIFTLAIAAAICGSAMAQTTPSATQVSNPAYLQITGGQMCLCVSSNGRYIGGATGSWDGFIYDTETETLLTTADVPESDQSEGGATEIVAISDDGVGYGFDANGMFSLDMNGKYTLIDATGNKNDPTVTSCTPDGSILTGYINTSFYDVNPCYWDKDGVHILEFSTSEEAGFKINGARALWVSADGKIIVGYLYSRSSRNPMVYWLRQDNGSYKYVDAFKDFYEDDRDVDGNYKTYYTTLKDKLFMPAAMSPDGKNVAMYIHRVLEQNGEYVLSPQEEVAIFNLEKNAYSQIIPYNEENVLYNDPLSVTITGLSNDGTLVGFSGDALYGEAIPFVDYAEDYNNALTLIEAFPGVDLLELYQDEWDDSPCLYITTGLSGDASTIIGYIELYDLSWTTFYIRTGWENTDGVNSIFTEGSDVPVYYNIQGQRVNNPDKGIYIKVLNGKAEKIIL